MRAQSISEPPPNDRRSVEPGLYMLLKCQKAACEENYETGTQTFSVRLRFLTIRAQCRFSCATYVSMFAVRIRRALVYARRVRRRASSSNALLRRLGLWILNVNALGGAVPSLRLGLKSDFARDDGGGRKQSHDGERGDGFS
jgi:hypothetical protein